MIKPKCPGMSLLVTMMLAAWILPEALAEISGMVKVQRMDGAWMTGEMMQETPDAYVMKVNKKFEVKIPKTEVRTIQAVDETEAPPAAGDEEEKSDNQDEHGGVTDAEIAELLEGTDLAVPPADSALESELPLDEESVEEMKHIAGTDNIYTTKHVVVVYTSSRQDAVDIAARLEVIWRWRVAFMRSLGLRMQMPAHKLELYYFGTHQEFDMLQVNTGDKPNIGKLGVFDPRPNRSHFFNIYTWPPVWAHLAAAKNMAGPQKAREENLAKQWARFKTIETTQHELGHHIDFNFGLFPRFAFIDDDSLDSVPRWLVEGTTMMFEVPPSSEGASLGAVNYHRLDLFRKSYHKFTPDFIGLFVVDNHLWSAHTYPLGWSLVYYLWQEKRAGLRHYYRIIAARDPGDLVSYTQRRREFEECFGKIDQKWVDDWWKFMQGLPLKRSVLPPENFP